MNDKTYFEIITSNNTMFRYATSDYFWQFALVQGTIDELDKSTVEVIKKLEDDDYLDFATYPNIVRVGEVHEYTLLSLPEKQLCVCPRCGYKEVNHE